MFIKLLIFYRLHESPFGPVHTFSFNSRAIQDWVCGHNFSVLVIASAILESHLLADFFFFPPEMFPVFISLMWHCHEELCSLSGLSEASSPSSCYLLACEECSQVPGIECFASCVTSVILQYIRLYVLSPWPLQRRRNLAECADVRVVATVKEWCFAEEILDLAF